MFRQQKVEIKRNMHFMAELSLLNDHTEKNEYNKPMRQN